jgi:hypothetical protein
MAAGLHNPSMFRQSTRSSGVITFEHVFEQNGRINA